jgi:Na+/proline symporter
LSESYMYGVRMVINIVSVTLGYLYAFFIVQPFMYSLDEDIKTPYQYFEKRYNSKLIRSVSSFFGMLFYFSFLTLYLWGCTILLSTLIPQIPFWLASLIIGIYSLIGSTIGGFTQTTITNVVQFIILIVGLLAAIVLTIQTSKHRLSELWEFASKNNRTRFIETDTDFRTRYTVVNQLVSLPIPWCSIHSLLLPNFMRYRAVKGKARSRFLVVSNFPFMVLVNGLTLIGGGIVCFLYFYGCDPLKSGSILNKNATGAYWLYSILSEHAPSFCGIIFSSIICYSVVQHSMGISLCANTLVEETINPLYKFKLKDKSIKSLKLYITVLLGMLSILYSISFQFVKNTMLALFFLFNNTTNSPILGLFLLSAFNPFANAFGAITAFLLNLGINYWLGAGSFIFSHLKNQEFSTRDVLCEDKKGFSNLTSSSLISNNFNYYPENEVLFYLYSIAPIWYCLFSVLFMCIFGTLFSFLYSYFRNGSHDSDSYYREIRKRYLFFYS